MKKARSASSNSRAARRRRRSAAPPGPQDGLTGDQGRPHSELPDAGGIKPVPPSKDALQRLLAIPLLCADQASSERIAGRLALDSWQHGPAIALRDVADGHVRRLRFEAGRYVLEMLALRTGQKWEFTARLRHGDRVVHASVLRIGERRLLAQRGGYFCWSSSAVPRKLAVLLLEKQLVFDGILWR